MTRQEIFDKAAVGLLRQGSRSVSIHGACMYGSPTGQHCAIGFLIPEAHPAQEAFTSVSGLIDGWPDIKKILGGKRRLPFLSALQVIHDARNPDEWLKELKGLAKQFNLNTKALKEFEK